MTTARHGSAPLMTNRLFASRSLVLPVVLTCQGLLACAVFLLRAARWVYSRSFDAHECSTNAQRVSRDKAVRSLESAVVRSGRGAINGRKWNED
jgi:hypothetical protein